MNKLFTLLLLVTLPAFGQNNPCEGITVEESNFSKDYRLGTAVEENVSISKVRNNGAVKYYLTVIHFDDYRLSINPRSVDVGVIFNDGTKIEKKDTRLDIRYLSTADQYLYFTFIQITEREARLFEKKNVTDYMVHIFEGTISNEKSEMIRQQVECVLNR